MQCVQNRTEKHKRINLVLKTAKTGQNVTLATSFARTQSKTPVYSEEKQNKHIVLTEIIPPNR